MNKQAGCNNQKGVEVAGLKFFTQTKARKLKAPLARQQQWLKQVKGFGHLETKAFGQWMKNFLATHVSNVLFRLQAEHDVVGAFHCQGNLCLHVGARLSGFGSGSSLSRQSVGQSSPKLAKWLPKGCGATAWA